MYSLKYSNTGRVFSHKFRRRTPDGQALVRGVYHAHTNRFCVVQENMKPDVLEVQTELARSVH